MKLERNLKITFIILLIILISLISFGGIFIQNTKFVENIVPNYKLGTDLTGSRLVVLNASTATNTVIYDKDGNVVEKEGEGTTKKEEPVNPEDILTKENYQKVKKTFEARLDKLGVSNYTMRFDEETGKAYINLPENTNTDTILQYIAIKGDFQVVDDDNKVLLTSEHLKKAQVGYSNTASGTAVYLTMKFNKEGTQILKDITNTYVKTTDDEGKDTTKKVNFRLDDTTLISTYFEEEISNGTIQLSIGQASTSNSDINSYLQEASNIAVLLNTNALPITYTVSENRYMVSDITENMFFIPMIVAIVVFAIAVILLIIRYRKNGLLSAISFVGYIALLLLALRYCNVIITLEGIAGIAMAIIVNYILNIYLLNELKKETTETLGKILLKALFLLVPVTIIAVILSFTGWLPVASFGMNLFWGILASIIYNFIFTNALIEK